MALYTPLLVGTVASGTTIDQVTGGIDNLSGTIYNYGPLVVICSVFILAFLIMFGTFIKIFKNMINKLMNDANNDDEHGQESSHDQHSDHEANPSKPQKDPIKSFISSSVAFKGASKVAIRKLDCDRIAIYVFHNGTKSFYGLPFIKFSCIYEETKSGMNTIRGKEHKNVPLHLFDDFIDILYESKEFCCDADDEFWTNPKLQEFLSGSKTKSIFILPIKTDDDRLAGFTSCEFYKTIDVHEEHAHEDIKDTLKDFNQSIRYIVLNTAPNTNEIEE